MTEQRLHSVKSLANTLNVDRRRMSRLLQKRGLVPVGATLLIPIEATRRYRWGRRASAMAGADVLIRDVLAGKIAAFRTLGEPRLHAARVLMSDMVASRQVNVAPT